MQHVPPLRSNKKRKSSLDCARVDSKRRPISLLDQQIMGNKASSESGNRSGSDDYTLQGVSVNGSAITSTTPSSSLSQAKNSSPTSFRHSNKVNDEEVATTASASTSPRKKKQVLPEKSSRKKNEEELVVQASSANINPNNNSKNTRGVLANSTASVPSGGNSPTSNNNKGRGKSRSDNSNNSTAIVMADEKVNKSGTQFHVHQSSFKDESLTSGITNDASFAQNLTTLVSEKEREIGNGSTDFSMTEGQQRRTMMADHEFECSEITPFIFVGGAEVAGSYEILKSKNIKRIVNCSASIVDNHFVQNRNMQKGTPEFKYLSLKMVDGRDDDIGWFVCEVLQFLREGYENQERTLVHCEKGISRSCSYVISYCMWSMNLTWELAFNFVKSKRMVCNPNAAFTCNQIEFKDLLPEGGQANAHVMYRMASHLPHDIFTPVLKMLRNSTNRKIIVPSSKYFDPDGIFVIRPGIEAKEEFAMKRSNSKARSNSPSAAMITPTNAMLQSDEGTTNIDDAVPRPCKSSNDFTAGNSNIPKNDSGKNVNTKEREGYLNQYLFIWIGRNVVEESAIAVVESLSSKMKGITSIAEKTVVIKQSAMDSYDLSFASVDSKTNGGKKKRKTDNAYFEADFNLLKQCIIYDGEFDSQDYNCIYDDLYPKSVRESIQHSNSKGGLIDVPNLSIPLQGTLHLSPHSTHGASDNIAMKGHSMILSPKSTSHNHSDSDNIASPSKSEEVRTADTTRDTEKVKKSPIKPVKPSEGKRRARTSPRGVHVASSGTSSNNSTVVELQMEMPVSNSKEHILVTEDTPSKMASTYPPLGNSGSIGNSRPGSRPRTPSLSLSRGSTPGSDAKRNSGGSRNSSRPGSATDEQEGRLSRTPSAGKIPKDVTLVRGPTPVEDLPIVNAEAILNAQASDEDLLRKTEVEKLLLVEHKDILDKTSLSDTRRDDSTDSTSSNNVVGIAMTLPSVIPSASSTNTDKKLLSEPMTDSATSISNTTNTNVVMTAGSATSNKPKLFQAEKANTTYEWRSLGVYDDEDLLDDGIFLLFCPRGYTGSKHHYLWLGGDIQDQAILAYNNEKCKEWACDEVIVGKSEEGDDFNELAHMFATDIQIEM